MIWKAGEPLAISSEKSTKITCTFAKEHNPGLSALIRNTLLDSYIKRVGLGVDDGPMDAYSILSECAACQ